MLCTKAIVSPELNDVLYIFLTRFKDHLENKTLHKMCYYFSKVDLKEYRESIRIKSVEDYEIALVDSGYDIIVIYWNYIVERKYFGFRFNIENKHLKITVPPQIRQPAVTLENNSDNARKLKKLLHLYPPDKTGKSTIPEELLEALIPPKPD
ncbi:MAG: hypothetical protein H8E57_06720 [Candidatus Cloacimonetes bacterium]|nr:hypothetical protein [Candidatus Cloacimonadota bacterium]